ncbi:YbaB/EbfC DNA-binding family protein [Saccharopolyspora erythraea NRRL 2338]|uniref:Uncharacterized protein n=2 Tax=Saccharopolyspora erythraea TaxID=1836 RepID=A4FNP0_SACEN|nr:YbaB/EbfC family nucleoid-associated protein [Saccharopolyspora erythraea]EQD82734.1 hypothetical protein N599_29075 [Saccharopolyspora erythraea D]PFG99303.1 YbaB/EbfC DNA-binding family protein [Saccharopolyspora erythraea NRRL 2338]QRK89237.1 YbaB/EbfC family nucleoid-associated protein [Saccharopolyspora erythraea]CAM05665.1 hypothetical protein SACE_6496 [Saccharopolyspora erythraea NRRL 2338]
MPTDHRAEVAELLADYRRSRERLEATRQELAALTETARSEDGSVEVTVGPQGVLRDLHLSDDVHERYHPARLSALIVRLTTEAAGEVVRRAADALAPIVPEGTDPAVLLGPHQPAADEPVDAVDEEPVDDEWRPAHAERNRS